MANINWDNEVKYRLAERTILQLAECNHITGEDFVLLRDQLIDYYKPTIGELERGMSYTIRFALADKKEAKKWEKRKSPK